MAPCKIDAVALAAKGKFDAFVDQAFVMRALAGADFVEQRDGAFFKKAGTNAAQHVFRRVTLQDHVVDAVSVQQLPKQQTGWPRANDRDFGPQLRSSSPIV